MRKKFLANYGGTDFTGRCTKKEGTGGGAPTPTPLPIVLESCARCPISGAGYTTFNGTLPVLPGDFNDDGKVDDPDETGILDEILGMTKPTVFGDISGDGKVTTVNYMYTWSVRKEAHCRRVVRPGAVWAQTLRSRGASAGSDGSSRRIAAIAVPLPYASAVESRAGSGYCRPCAGPRSMWLRFRRPWHLLRDQKCGSRDWGKFASTRRRRGL